MASGKCRTGTDRVIPVLFCWDVSPNVVGCFQAEPGWIWELQEEFCGGLLLLQEVLLCG